MKKIIRSFIPNSVVNYGYHLPLALLGNLLYFFPSKKLKLIAVTGTDGKTTTVNMIYHLLKSSGKKVSMISTVNAVIGAKVYDSGLHVTTPNALHIQKFLREAVKAGQEYVVLEVSSHAISQFRIFGLRFEVGVITNITPEHLDYHGSFASYRMTKLNLARYCKAIVINSDDPNQNINLLKKINPQIKLYSYSGNTNTKDKVDIFNIASPLKLKILGEYNKTNAKAALTAGLTLGLDKNRCLKILQEFETIPGRLEEIENKLGLKIYVDFAHTPNALENVLKTLKLSCKSRLIVLFGAPSERDVYKRPHMGKAAAKYADIIILTDDDPRFEDQNNINKEIALGVLSSKFAAPNLYQQPNRVKAIQLALSLAKKGDTIAFCGKGHEQSMSYQGKEHPWCDKKVVEQIINNTEVTYNYILE
jgi:UDP-N-acetylmuramoyl-L-alanyl-D-glutamate--2,6-diaminopimelate ligase